VPLCFQLHTILWLVHGLVTDIKQFMSVIKTSQLMLFREIIGFDYDDNMKHKNVVGRIKSF
jgi:hypothetical protein